MRKSRISLLAVAVILVGASLVVALSYTPISNHLTTGTNTVTNPTLAIYWVIPIPASEYASSPVTASLNINNIYGGSFVNLVLVMNFTGSGVTSTCATAGTCVQGFLTIGSTTVSMSECTSCGTTTLGSTPVPEAILTGIIPSLPTGNNLVTLSLSFIQSGVFNQNVYLATETPYP